MSIQNVQKLYSPESFVEYFNAPKFLFPKKWKNIFPILFPQTHQQRKIDRIKEQAIAFLKTRIQKALKGEEVEDLSLNEAFGRKLISDLYQQGFLGFNEFAQQFNGLTNPPDFDTFCEYWRNRVCKDFEDGKLCSLPMMAYWIAERCITFRYSLQNQPPFNDLQKCIHLLQRLAHLGVKMAQDALASACFFGELGTGDDEIRVNLSPLLRLQGLVDLSKSGHAMSQIMLGDAYSSNSLNKSTPLSCSEEERRKGMQELIDEEREFNPHVAMQYGSNRIGDLHCNYSLNDRIEFFKKRAKRGDELSFTFFWHLYGSNKIGKEVIELTLTEQERWGKLKELKREVSDPLFRMFYTRWVIEPPDLLPCSWSPEERLKWLEDEAFNKGNEVARDHLCRFYADTRWGWVEPGATFWFTDWIDFPLKLSFDERYEGLVKLARLGNYDAMHNLGVWNRLDRDLRHKNSPVAKLALEKLDSTKTTFFNEDKISKMSHLSRLFEIAFEGNQVDFIADFTGKMKDSPMKKTMEFAIAHWRGLNRCGL
jgi:hypothetical protein